MSSLLDHYGKMTNICCYKKIKASSLGNRIGEENLCIYVIFTKH